MLPEILPEVAVMLTKPGKMHKASPSVETTATDKLPEVQATCVVISWLVPSEYMPVAVNCTVAPTNTPGLVGVTDIELRTAEVTVRLALPEILPKVAVMGTVPTEMDMARPLLLTAATAGFPDRQVTCRVISKFVPSE